MPWEPVKISMEVYCRDTDIQSFAVEFVEEDFQGKDICTKDCTRVEN